MVNKDMLKTISTRLTELCREFGIADNLEVKCFFDEECDVPIPKEIANSSSEAVAKICEELRKLKGIKSIFDRGATRVIRGDDYRQFEIMVEDGHWTHSEADERASEEAMRHYFDDDYAKQKAEEDMKRRREHWTEYLIPMPIWSDEGPTEIYLTMAYEPYDWIDKGYDEDGRHVYKREEFRAYNDYYAKKLLSHPIKTVRFQRGYGGPGRPKPAQMRFEVKAIQIWDPTQKISCSPFKPTKGIVPQFFIIELGNRL